MIRVMDEIHICVVRRSNVHVDSAAAVYQVEPMIAVVPPMPLSRASEGNRGKCCTA